MAQTILELQLKGVKEAQADMQRLSEEIVKQKQKQAELKTEMKATEKAFKDGEISQEDYTKAMAQNNIEQTKSKKIVSENTAQLKQNIRVVNAQEGSLDQLRASLNLLQKEYGQLNKETDEGAARALEMSEQIERLTLEVKSQEKAIGDTRRNVGNYEDAIKDAVGSMIPFGGQLTEIAQSGGGVKGALASITTGIQGATRAAIAFIATPIGAAITALAAIGAATKAWFDYNKEIRETNQLLAGITDQTGETLDNIRRQTAAIEETLGVSAEESAKAAKVLVQQFGISYEEALDKMQTGILATNGANDELLASIGEYSVFFADAGFSVDEFTSIVNAGFDLGIYTDKLPDALKEADISLREQTKATTEALTNAFGEEFTGDILNQINVGALSTKDALSLISLEAEKVGLTAEQAATLTADVFRGAGEDAGGALKIFQAVAVGVGGASNELDEYGKSLEKEIGRTVEMAEEMDAALMSPNFIKFQETLAEIGHAFKIILADALSFVMDALKPVGDAFSSLGEALGLSGDSAIGLADILGFLTKVGLMPLKAALAIVSGVVEVLAKGVEFAKNSFNNVREAVVNLTNKFPALSIVVEKISDAFAFVKDSAMKLVDGLKEVMRFVGVMDQSQGGVPMVKAIIENAIQGKKAAEELAESTEQVTEATEEVTTSTRQYTEAIVEATDAVGDLARAEEQRRLDNMANAKKEFNDRIKEIKDSARLELLERETGQLQILRNFVGTEEERAQLVERFEADNLQLRKKAIQDQIDFLEEVAGRELGQASALGIISPELIKQSEDALVLLRNQFEKLNQTTAETGKNPETGEIENVNEKLGLTPEDVEEAIIALDSLSEAFGIAQQAIGAAETSRLREVEKQLEQGVITEQQAANKKERIQRNFARKQQAISILDAITNTALGITNALTVKPAFLAPIQAAIAAATGAAQIATIRSQRYAKGGILNGPSHAQGGIPMFSKGGAFYGEAEGGEAVLTKGVMKNPALARMASAINVAGGGVPFFANGGVLDPIQSATPTDRAADIIASGMKSQQPVLVVEQLRERENSVDVIESLRTIG